MRRITMLWWAAAILAASASSAGALSFRIDTNSIKVHAGPGETANRRFWLTLDKAEKPTRFKLHTEDWWRSEDGKQSFYRPAGTVSRSCANWVKLNPVEALVGGGETLNVQVTVAVPPDVKPGGYWCALTVDEVPDPLASTPGIAARFTASISTGIFVYVGPLDQRAKISAIQVLPDRAEVKLQSEANCPLGVEGRFEFVAPGAKEPAAVVPIARGTLLPEPVSTILLSSKMPDASTLPAGRYLVRAIIDIGTDHYIGVQKQIDLQRDGPNGAPTK